MSSLYCYLVSLESLEMSASRLFQVLFCFPVVSCSNNNLWFFVTIFLYSWREKIQFHIPFGFEVCSCKQILPCLLTFPSVNSCACTLGKVYSVQGKYFLSSGTLRFYCFILFLMTNKSCLSCKKLLLLQKNPSSLKIEWILSSWYKD